MTRRSILALAAVLSMLFAVLPLTAAGAAGAVVFINEIHYDNTGGDVGEFVEIAGPAGIDLTGWTLVLYNGNGGGVYGTTALAGSLVDDGSGFGFSAVPVAGLQNGSPDGVALVDDGGVVVQFLSYEGSTTAANGAASGMTSTDIGVSEGGDTPVGHSLQLTGSGTGSDDFSWNAPAAESPGAVNAGQTFGGGGTTTTTTTSTTIPPLGPVADVIINEVDSDTAGSDTLEFVELYAISGGEESLSGLTLVFYNGSSDTSYRAMDLDLESTNSDGYFTICNVGVPGCDLSLPNNGLQNGADAVVLVAGGSTDYPSGSPLPSDSLIVDALVYDTNDADDAGLLGLLNPGQVQVNEGGAGDKDGHSNQRCPNGTGGNQNTDTYEQWAPTPGVENLCEIPVVPPVPVFIHEIQGTTDTNLLDGVVVEVEGVVVGDFQGFGPGLGGFFVQEEDADVDGDPLTSEGIFVFQGSPFTDVSVGDIVKVTGTVDEQFGLTQIEAVTSVVITGAGVVSPAVASLPLASATELEAIEGMSVVMPQTLYATETFTQGRFGQVALSGSARLDIPTNVLPPGPAADALGAANDLNRIELDDGDSTQNPDPTPFLGVDGTLRGGDSVTGLTGVMGYSFGTWEVLNNGSVPFVRENPRPGSAPSVGGDITVASFNVLNYFTTIDTGASICGPLGDSGCRGADTAEEFNLQSTKIVNAMVKLDADVVGLMEIENHATDEAVDDLVSRINAIMGPGTYVKAGSGPIGGDAIRVAIIYKPGSVTPMGASAILDQSVDPLFLDSKNRPVMAQTFVDNGNGATFTVAVNHLKSKGSACDDVGDPDAGDGQGNCNGVRTDAATALVNWLAADPTGSGDPDYLIIGDLNSYAMEDPIAAITGAGYTDLIRSFQGVGVAGNGYSYVFAGEWGYLDHALANGSMMSQVTGTEPWRINADEPPALDYNNFNNAGNQTTDEFRSSDHDPIVVGLSLATSPLGDISYARSVLDDVYPTGNRHTDRHLAKAARAIDKALNPIYWVGDDMVNSKKVFRELKKAVRQIEKARDHGILDPADAADAIGPLVKAARALAVKALEDAAVAPLNPKHIAHGYVMLAKGDAANAEGDFNKAIKRYKNAWREAEKALKAPKVKKSKID